MGAATATRATRRAGRRREHVLRAAGEVLAERGAEGTRFADVSAASGVPISTLQYYFGNREDLIVATFRHEVLAELAALSELVHNDDDPWQQLVSVIRLGVVDSERSGTTWRIWVEFWRAALRDDELRLEAHAAYHTWRSLVARVIQAGLDSHRFQTDLSAEDVANLVVALIDGIGVPAALTDPVLPREDGTTAGLVEHAVARLVGIGRHHEP